MTAAIIALQPDDHITLDPTPVARIYRETGIEAADCTVARLTGWLTLEVGSATAIVNGRNLADLSGGLDRIIDIAGRLGMTTLAETARDARTCLEDFDATAFSAIWARLLRVAGVQLTQGVRARKA